MAKHTNVRYSLATEDISKLQRVQVYLQKKLRVNKVSQVDALRHMLDKMQAEIDADNLIAQN